MWEGYVQPYAANGVLADLTPYVQADPEWKMDDFQPAAVEAGSYQGKSIPSFAISTLARRCSSITKTLFDKAKVDYPTFDWDWAKMRDAAKALTKDTNGDGKEDQWGLAFETWFVVWLHWIWSNGGDLFNSDQTKCALSDQSAATEAIQFGLT